MSERGAASTAWPSLAAVALIALFTALGFWQIGRHEVKQELWNAFEASGERAARKVESGGALDALGRYTPVVLRGRYDLSRQILLDNRIHDGRVGVEVFTPLDLRGGGLVLVNRGWTSLERGRALPALPGPAGPLTVRGLVAPAPSPGIRLGDVREPDDWPWLTPYLLPDLARSALGAPLAESVVLLDPDAPGGFRRDWAPAMMAPERHLGYAVQWFALALAVAVVWVLLTVRHRRRKA